MNPAFAKVADEILLISKLRRAGAVVSVYGLTTSEQRQAELRTAIQSVGGDRIAEGNETFGQMFERLYGQAL